jgi:hypothetical protein
MERCVRCTTKCRHINTTEKEHGTDKIRNKSFYKLKRMDETDDTVRLSACSTLAGLLSLVLVCTLAGCWCGCTLAVLLLLVLV